MHNKKQIKGYSATQVFVNIANWIQWIKQYTRAGLSFLILMIVNI